MVISFEEKDRAAIESKGMMIIEFKCRIYNTNKSITELWKMLQEATTKVAKALDVFIEKFFEVADSVKLIVEQICEAWNYPTSSRYHIVKVLSKCTGINISSVWEATWKIKRWIVRSRY